MPFYGRLVMRIKRPVQFEFIRLSSFRGGLKATGEPAFLTMLSDSIKKRDVIAVEDVADTARTLSILVKYLKSKKPKSIRTLVLANKPDMRKVKFKPDYACFEFKGDPFLIGYGLDIKEQARNLPYIAEFDKKYFNKI
ncbi:MAG: hypoxanthine phosphoribosyltransferase [Mycoplasmoidaceae bacterium]|nr:hypoxanthine phosphoribosyltransferase [Mycoplasmoidaceae bacterium]